MFHILFILSPKLGHQVPHAFPHPQYLGHLTWPPPCPYHRPNPGQPSSLAVSCSRNLLIRLSASVLFPQSLATHSNWSDLSQITFRTSRNSTVYPACLQDPSWDTQLSFPAPPLTPSPPTLYIPTMFSLLSLTVADHSPRRPPSLTSLPLLASLILMPLLWPSSPCLSEQPIPCASLAPWIYLHHCSDQINLDIMCADLWAQGLGLIQRWPSGSCKELRLHVCLTNPELLGWAEITVTV